MKILGLLMATALPLCAAEETKPLLTLGKVKVVELSVETFATYSVNRGGFEDALKSGFRGGSYGSGLAVSAFFGEHVGLRLDAASLDVEDADGIDYGSATALLRFPTTLRIDPYAGAGIGYNVESERVNTHVEAGLEFRLSKSVYARAAYRHVFESRGEDRGSVIAGIGYRW